MEPESTKLCSQEAHNWLAPRAGLIRVSDFRKIIEVTKLPTNWVLSKALCSLFIVLPSFCFLLVTTHCSYQNSGQTSCIHETHLFSTIPKAGFSHSSLFTRKALSGESRKMRNSLLYTSSSIYYTAVNAITDGLDMLLWCNKNAYKILLRKLVVK